MYNQIIHHRFMFITDRKNLMKMARHPGVLLTSIIFLISLLPMMGQKYMYSDGWGSQGFSLAEEKATGVVVNFTVDEFETLDAALAGEVHQQLLLPGHFLFSDEGTPDLPGSSRYILVPEGAVPQMQVLRTRSDTLHGLNIMPAPKVPVDTDHRPMEYRKDSSVYLRDAYFPESPVMIQTGMKIRGMSVVILSIVPFQYNPVTKDLIVHRDLQVKIDFAGGSGEFGIEKYRSRWWDPILKNHVLNFSSLPVTDYSSPHPPGNRTFNGCEYLIISPDGADFQQWADSIRRFRTEQGILTEIRTITEVGGNTSAAIETYIDNAFNTWDIPPSAVLLLGDHGTDPLNSITSVILNNHPSGYNPYVSDNVYADVDGDDLPDIAFARITARNAAELELMVHKFMNYERNPPTSPDFYDHPITALGWQTERWFQICSEVVGGFMKNELGKNPVRINAIYEGNPDIDPWSTASNTTTVLNYFGPTGQNYIPSSPTALGGWTGGTSTGINNAINGGSFLLQHRDHGAYWGWGEPYYHTAHLSGLTNTDLTYVMSVNCQTGQFDIATETFTERFHRYSYNGAPSGALGLIAATQVSYSFVNDVYIWGLYDYMWPDFMPTFGSNPAPGGLLPCFGNVAGKYHLQQSSWTGTSVKGITYRLFHHHGDAYLELYSEVPQSLTVAHDNFILPAATTFSVTANPGALIALTTNGELLGTATGTGVPVDVSLSGTLVPGDDLVVTVTLTNHYRYRALVDINAPAGPYVIYGSTVVNDAAGNNNGQLDCGETTLLTIGLGNIGSLTATDVSAVLRSSDTLVQIVDSLANYGNIPAGDTLAVTDGFQATTSSCLPDGHNLLFGIEVTDGTNTWTDAFVLQGHAPALAKAGHQVDDPGGNGNGILDPGETADLIIFIKNTGTTTADSCVAHLTTNDPNIIISNPVITYGDIIPGDTVNHAFTVTAEPLTPPAQGVTLFLATTSDNSLPVQDSFEIVIGKFPALVLDLDPNTSSGPAMVTAMQASGVTPVYSTTFPADLPQYQSIFCCLGIYSTNYVLLPAEGQLLADYLDGGGRLYLEGGDTWAWDTPTAVHPMFSIDGLSDGSGDLGTISGLPGALAGGMSFTYSGENSYIDRLSPAYPAVNVLQNNSPAYNTCISNDQGNYKTIGASHEFGGLADGSSIKARLMGQYLMFFGVQVTCEWAGITDDWSDPDNWSNGTVPGPATRAVIPVVAGGIYPQQFPAGIAVCKSLSVDPGVDLTIPAGVVFTVNP